MDVFVTTETENVRLWQDADNMCFIGCFQTKRNKWKEQGVLINYNIYFKGRDHANIMEVFTVLWGKDYLTIID